MKMAHVAAMAAAFLLGTAAAGFGQTPIPACLSAADAGVRERCVRASLASSDPDVRSAALETALRTRKLVVIVFDEPPSVVEFRNKVAKGEARFDDARGEVSDALSVIAATSRQVSLRIDRYDPDTRTLALTAVDANFRDGVDEQRTANNSKGFGTIAGTSLELNFAYTGARYQTACNAVLQSQDAGGEMAGTFACRGLLPPSPARLRLFR